MANNDPRKKELKRTIRLLREIESIAERANMTGAYGAAGARQSALQVNTILRRLEQLNEVAEGYFTPLAEDSSFDVVGITAAQLATYIHEEETEDKEIQHNGPKINFEINGPVGNLADLEQLRELGALLRDQMPEWFTGKGKKAAEPQVAPEAESAAPAPAPAPAAASQPPTPPQPPRAALAAPEAHPAQFTPDVQARQTRV